ncbi:MAG TPA: methyltransferase domain-containing protein [Acidimicrobiales bacterium]|nr:methyltransferase domain-containing protein [Acidimicrobiales bacterium]
MALSSPYSRDFFADTERGGLTGARLVVRNLLELLPIGSVVDLGCGTGTWLAAFVEAGVDDVTGVDGDWVPRQMLNFPVERFVAHDLGQPVRLGRGFDLAVSLETAEHLPAGAADSFVASLVGLAPVVLFSAAVPGQGGTGHVNEQWPEYWARRFGAHGYRVIDCLRPRFWHADDLASCIRQNVLLFASDLALRSNPLLADKAGRSPDYPLAVIHPEEFIKATDPGLMSLRWTAARLPRVALHAARRRLRRAVQRGGRPPEA